MTPDELSSAVERFVREIGETDAKATDLADALLAYAAGIGAQVCGREATANVLTRLAEALLLGQIAANADAMLEATLRTRH